MSDEIHFDGVRYISANAAAEMGGFTRDYIARLARAGKLRGKQVGKNWYVDADHFQRFLAFQAYAHEKRRESLAEERTREYRQKNGISGSLSAPSNREYRELRIGRDDGLQNSDEYRATRDLHTEDSVHQKYSRAPVTVARSHVHPLLAKAATVSARKLHHGGRPGVAPLYAVTPAMNFLHKVIALITAFTLTFGTYAAVDPAYAHFAIDSFKEVANTVSDAAIALTDGRALAGVSRATVQVAAVAANPTASAHEARASISSALSSIAKTFNGRVNGFMYSIMFQNGGNSDPMNKANDRGYVAVQVVPYQPRVLTNANTNNPRPVKVDSASSTKAITIINNKISNPVSVVERVKEVERLVTVGGISEEMLNLKLNQLDNKLTSKMFSLVSNTTANYTPIVPFAQSQRIDALSGAAISGGTITNATITGGSVMATAFSGTLPIANGGTGISTAPSYGQLLVGNSAGGYTLTATSSLGISGGSGSPGGSDTQVQYNNSGSFAGSSSFTFNSSTGRLSVSYASTTADSTLDGLFVGRTSTTSIFGSATSTFGAGIQTTALNVTSTSATSTFANGIRLSGGCFQLSDGTCAGTGGSGAVSSVSNSDSTLTISPTTGAVVASLNLGNVNTWTALQKLYGSASSTLFSANRAYFGGTATSSFDTAGVLTLASALTAANGGTGFSSYTPGDILYAQTATSFARVASSTNGFVLTLANGIPSWVATSTLSTISGTLGIAQGGTNNVAYSTNSLSYFDGTKFAATSTQPLYVGSINATTTGNNYFGGALGIASSSPWALLSINPSGIGSGPEFAIGSSTQTDFVVTNSGKVGVGTSTPGSVFAVQSVANFTTGTSTFLSDLKTTGIMYIGSTVASSTFANGLNLTSGCFSINGNCVGGSGGGSGTVTSITAGSGLTGGTITTAGTIAVDFTNANTWTGLQKLYGAASSTLFSAHQAWFGATATSSFDAAGVLTLAGGLNGPLDARNGIVGATTSIGVLYGGTGATTASGARTNLAAAASGANSDITSISGLTTALSVPQGGTGWAAVQSGTVLYGNGSGALSTTTAGTNGFVLTLSNGIPAWVATTTLANVSGTLGIGSGGTNATSLGSHMLLGFDGTRLVSTSTPTAAFYLATSTTAASSFPYASTTALTVSGANGLTLGSLTGPLQAISGAVSATSTLSVGYGGTGLTAFTQGSVVFGGTGALAQNNSNFFFDNTLVGLGIGTTTPRFTMALSSSTAPQLALTDTTGTSNPWTLRSISNAFYLSTSSPTTFATSTTPAFAIDVNGNVGIGTSTPGSKFSIGGVANFTTATSSLNGTGGINLAGGCFAINGSCVGGSGGGSGTVTSITAGSGLTGGTITTAGTIAVDFTNANTWTGLQKLYGSASSTLFSANQAYFGGTATTTIDTAGNISAQQATTTNLAISTIASGSLLKTTTGGAVIAATAGTDYTTFGYLFPSNATSTLLSLNGGLTAYASSTIGDGTQMGGLTISGGATTSASSYVGSNLTVNNLLTVSGSGTSNITGVLTVSNSRYVFNSTSFANSGGSANSWQLRNASGNSSTQPDIIPDGGSTNTGFGSGTTGNLNAIVGGLELTRWASTGFGIGTSSPSARLLVAATSSLSNIPLFALQTPTTSNLATTSVFIVDTDGKVGIGTTTPWAQLSVNPSGIGAGPEFVIGSSTQTDFVVTNSGRVGIGTTTPGSTFAINSIANFTTATSTLVSTGGWNIASGCYAIGGTCLTFSSLAGLINLTTQVTGTLGVGNGGTGATAIGKLQLLATDSSGNVISTSTPTASIFNATSTTQASTFPYASTTALTVSATNGLTLASLTGPLQAISGAVSASSTLSVFYGGTGVNTLASNGLLYGNGAGAIQATAAVNTGALVTSSTGVPSLTSGGTANRVLRTDGTTVSFAQVALGTDVSGTLPTANGGTNHGNYTAGSVTFAGTSGTSLTENNTNFFWDNTLVGMGIGTTTPRFTLNIATSTAPQLALSDTTGTSNPWTLRSISNSFYLSTSSPTTFATSTTPAFAIDVNGNVGIATSTPGSKFSIGGVANFTTATSSFYGVGGLNLAGGCFAIGGACLSTGGSTNAAGGTGAVQFANGTSFTANASNFFFDNTLVGLGLGTTTPRFMLAISTSTAPQLALTDTTGTSNLWTLRSISNSFYLSTSSPSTFATSTTAALSIDPNGIVNLASGHTSYASSTIGSGTRTSGLTISGGATTTGVAYFASNVGIGTAAPANLLSVETSSTASGVTVASLYSAANASGVSTTTLQLEKGTGYGGRISGYLEQGVGSGLRLTTLNGGTPLDVMTLTNTGNVGIGTTSPAIQNTAGRTFLTIQGSSLGGVLELASRQADANANVVGLLQFTDAFSSRADKRVGLIFSSLSGTTANDRGSILGFNTKADGGALAQRMTIDSSGNVGIGTTTPWGLLSVNPNGVSGPEFVVGSSTQTDFIVSNGGLSGHGTTSPFAMLSIHAPAGVPSFSIGSTTSNYFLVSSSGKVAIGTTTNPLARLEVYDSSAATTTNLILTNFTFATSSTYVKMAFRTDDVNHTVGTTTAAIGSILQQNYGAGAGDLVFSTLQSGLLTEAGRFNSGGRFGLGTTSPFRLLSLTGAVSTAQQAIAYDTTNYTDILTSAVGDMFLYPSGNDVLANNSNLWVCTGGSSNTNGCPTGAPTTQGNLIVETGAAIGTSTPSGNLLALQSADNTTFIDFTQAGNDRLKIGSDSSGNMLMYSGNSKDIRFGSSSAPTQLIVSGSSNKVGIGTTTPTKQLSVAELLYVGASGATGMGTATSTFQGDIKIIGKLDVSTIDPPYTIDGVKYATYVPSATGVKEETMQTVQLDTFNSKNGKYEATILFDTLEKGSDLWLFYQVTDFGDDWKSLVVQLTPSFDGKVFYKKDVAHNSLIISGDEQGEVSMRLSANRYDSKMWPNLRKDQDGVTEGTHVISSKKPGGRRAATSSQTASVIIATATSAAQWLGTATTTLMSIATSTVEFATSALQRFLAWL